MFVVAVDIGNSAIKLSANGNVIRVAASIDPVQQLEKIADAIKPFAKEKLFWAVCSVDRDATNVLKNWVTEHRSVDRFYEISADDIPLSSSVEDRNLLGRDRLLAAWRATEQTNLDSLIVVDAGTAVTIDVVQERCFIGGLIFPGAETCLTSVSEKTDALPNLALEPQPLDKDWNPENPAIGRSTQSAILLGVHQLQFVGTVEVASRLSQQFGAKVICTGGALASVSNHLPESWQHEANLVLGGAVEIANRIIASLAK